MTNKLSYMAQRRQQSWMEQRQSQLYFNYLNRSPLGPKSGAALLQASYAAPQSPPARRPQSMKFERRQVIEAPLERLTAIIDGRANYAHWYPRCNYSFAMSRPQAARVVAYMRFDGCPVLGVDDRDVVVESRMRRLTQRELKGASRGVSCKVELAEGFPEEPDCVRMASFKERIVLREYGANRTEVSYKLDMDVGGSVPSTLTGWALSAHSPEVLTKLASQAVHSGPITGQAALTHHLFDALATRPPRRPSTLRRIFGAIDAGWELILPPPRPK